LLLTATLTALSQQKKNLVSDKLPFYSGVLMVVVVKATLTLSDL